MAHALLSSLRARIVAVALIPCLAFAVVAALAVADRMAQGREMARLENLVGLSGKISAFVHEAQKERGASSLFLGSRGAQFGPELAAQRKLTDESRTALAVGIDATAAGDLGESFRRKIAQLAASLARIAEHRKAVEGLGVTPPRNLAVYSSIVADALAVVREVSQVATDPAIGANVSAYSAFLSLK